MLMLVTVTHAILLKNAICNWLCCVQHPASCLELTIIYQIIVFSVLASDYGQCKLEPYLCYKKQVISNYYLMFKIIIITIIIKIQM